MKKLTGKISEIIEKHRIYIDRSYSKIHQCGNRANFSKTDLSDATTLEKQYLEYADFREANLEEAFLKFSVLNGALFRGANLRGANLTCCMLRGADFCGADLTGANLSGADLTGAFFYGAKLNGVNFRSAVVERTDFTCADITATKFTRIIGSNIYTRSVKWPGFTAVYTAKKIWINGSEYSLAEFINSKQISDNDDVKKYVPLLQEIITNSPAEPVDYKEFSKSLYYGPNYL